MNNTISVATAADTQQQVWQSSHQQQAFRQLMTAFSYPGRVVALTTQHNAPMLVLATLLDAGCQLADPQHQLSADDLRRLGVRSGRVESSDFIWTVGTELLETAPCLGTLENPEQGSTILIRVTSLNAGSPLRLTGPGIADEQIVCVDGIDPQWWQQRAIWNRYFPMGVDIMLLTEQAVVALPRTTHIQVLGGC